MSSFPSGPHRVVAGIGCRQSATVAELVGLIEACLAEAGLAPSALAALATRSDRAGHVAIVAAARRFGVEIVPTAPETLAGQSVPTPSARVKALAGLASVAEAAAMAHGPLLLKKRKSGAATCALSLRLAADDPARAA